MSDSWLIRNYGSRRGFVRTYWYRLLYHLGKYNRNIDWREVERLVFICKGNICRSAYAEEVARQLGVEAISCGLDTIENAPANAAAQLAAKRFGLNLENHKTKPVMYLALEKTDLLVAMEPWQEAFLKKHIKRNHQYMLLGLCGEPNLPHIQDPYGASPEYFDKCFSYIHVSVQALVQKMSQ